MSTTVVFEDQAIMRSVCGANDRNIGYMELLLHGNIFVHGNSLSFEQNEESGEEEKQLFTLLMQNLKEAAAVQPDIFEPEIYMEYQQILHPSQDRVDLKSDSIAVGSRVIYPKSFHQKEFINMMKTKQLVFGIGPAGTGKTFLAIAFALKEVLSGRKQKIIITRPVVEAGENLGFLPGDLTQKLGPYLTPVYDAMEYLVPPHVVKRLQESESIESAPLAYMRGRSFNNACVLLDEGQNTTVEQMKMFLTRLSETSMAIVTGDITQIDLPRRKNSGLVHAARILHNVPGIGFVEFSSSDVIRSELVQRIINAYESEPFSKE